MHHEIFIMVECRMLSHIESLEQLLEVVLLLNIVVGFKHVQEQALAEAARANKEEKVTCPFHPLEEHGLVDQVFVLAQHLLEVGDAVGYLLDIVVHRFFHLRLSFLQIYAISSTYASIYSIKRKGQQKKGRLLKDYQKRTAPERTVPTMVLLFLLA